jgi:hypothetical protein
MILGGGGVKARDTVIEHEEEDAEKWEPWWQT